MVCKLIFSYSGWVFILLPLSSVTWAVWLEQLPVKTDLTKLLSIPAFSIP